MARAIGLGWLRGFFYGYWILLICVILHAMGSGEFFYGFSVFYTPILLEFGWSSAVTAGAFSLSRLEGGLEGPVIGWLVDRYGARKLLLFGIVVTGLGFMAMTRVNSVLLLYVVYGGLLSFGYNTGFTHAMTSLVARWFIRKRSRAMSLYAMSAGIGGALLVPILARSISSLGWRTTALICGMSFWALGLPLGLIIRDRPEEMGLLPDGLDPGRAAGTSSEWSLGLEEGPSLEMEYTAGEALRSATFWKLTLAESFRSFLLGSVVIHQIPYLASIGVPQETAATILGLMITLSIPGRLVFGSLGDFYSKRKLLIFAMSLQALGLIIFARATGIVHAYAFVIIYGIAYGGAIPLLMSYRGELFGRERFATISGMLAPFKMVGNVIGPVFAGYIFDVYRDYRLAFYAFTVLALLSAATFIFMNQEEGSGRVVTKI